MDEIDTPTNNSENSPEVVLSGTKFRWNKVSEEAAKLKGEGLKKDVQILAFVNAKFGSKKDPTPLPRNTFYRWLRHPEFADRVASIKAAYRKALLEEGLSDRQYRLSVLEDLKERLLTVQEARAAEGIAETNALLEDIATAIAGDDEAEKKRVARLSPVAGIESGLLIKKWVKSGSHSYDEAYEVDTATVKAIQEVLKQAAIEVGQWNENIEIGTAVGEITIKEVIVNIPSSVKISTGDPSGDDVE
jgi:hypothetical protein